MRILVIPTMMLFSGCSDKSSAAKEATKSAMMAVVKGHMAGDKTKAGEGCKKLGPAITEAEAKSLFVELVEAKAFALSDFEGSPDLQKKMESVYKAVDAKDKKVFAEFRPEIEHIGAGLWKFCHDLVEAKKEADPKKNDTAEGEKVKAEGEGVADPVKDGEPKEVKPHDASKNFRLTDKNWVTEISD
jgi:hypothetical protein